MKPTFPKARELADAASTAAQKTYLALNVTQLGLLAATAFVAGINTSNNSYRHCIAWTVCALMMVVLICTTAIRIGKFDVRWFKCRAFAENSKSLAWRFVMVEGEDCNSGREAYLFEWKRLKERLPELQGEFALASGYGELITTWMEESSQLPLTQKVQLYRKERLQDQINWYAKNSKQNGRRRSQWFWALFLLEAGVIFCAALQAWLLPNINAVGFVVAVGSGIVAWNQVKRHSDLSTSYAIAAEDLNLIAERFRTVVDQKTLNAFVDDVEEAVSREHSMWLARRTC